MIRTERAHLRVAAQTHPGMTGKNNEDRYAVTAFRLGRTDATPALLAVLCDGIGGHKAGEVAAEKAVDMITQTVAASSGSQPVPTLQKAIQAASNQIYALSSEDEDQKGMGATCACAWVIGKRLYATTVGDSRIYLLRGGGIQQLSTDHTWIQEALENGLLKPEEASGHPNAHVIRRFLGSPTPPLPDFRLRQVAGESNLKAEANQGMRLLPGDQLLLCSDGLTDLVRDTEILSTMQSLPPDQAAQSLVDQANARGGHDNITVVLLNVPPGRGGVFGTGIRWPWIAAGCVGLAILVLAVAIGLASLGLLTLSLRSTETPTPTATLPPALQTALPGGGGLPSPIVPLVTPTPTLTPFPTVEGLPPVPILTPVTTVPAPGPPNLEPLAPAYPIQP